MKIIKWQKCSCRMNNWNCNIVLTKKNRWRVIKYLQYSTYFICRDIVESPSYQFILQCSWLLLCIVPIGRTENRRCDTNTCPNAEGSHTNKSEQNVDEGEASSSSNIRVYAKKLKKRRKYLIEKDAEGNTDEDTNMKPNLIP